MNCKIFKILTFSFLLIFLACKYIPQERQSKAITATISEFDNGNEKELVYRLEKYLTDEDLPDYLSAQIATKIHSYYYYSDQKKFNIEIVNSQIDKYFQSSQSFNNKKLFNTDYSIFSMGASLNGLVGNLERQEEYLIILKEGCEKFLNKGNKNNYINTLADLSMVLENLNKFEESIKVAEDGLSVSSANSKKSDGIKIQLHLTIASNYVKLGFYSKAVDQLKYAKIEADKFIYSNSELYMEYLQMISYSYSIMSMSSEAAYIQEQIVKRTKEVYGYDHPEYFTSLIHLCYIYSQSGDYSKALKFTNGVVNECKKELGENHPLLFKSLDQLASIYLSLGDYTEALKISLDLVNKSQNIIGNDNFDYLSYLDLVMVSYLYLGDNRRALNVGINVTKLKKEAYGEKHQYYLSSLSNLASTYSNLENFTKAIEIGTYVTNTRREIQGEFHRDYIGSLHDLAFYYEKGKSYDKSLQLLQTVVAKYEQVLGKNHPIYLKSLSNLGKLYLYLEEYDKSINTSINAIEGYNLVLGNNHPDYLVSLYNLAIGEQITTKWEDSFKHYSEYFSKVQVRIIDYFALLTENQREQLWNLYKTNLELFPLFFEKTYFKHPEIIRSEYDASLFIKGLLLNTSRDFEQIIEEQGSPETITKFEELKLLKLQIQKLSEQPIDQRYIDVDSLQDIAQQKETELVKLSKEYGDYTRNLKINWKDVQSRLNKNEVAIEFVEYPTLSDTIKYAALLLKKDWEYPKMVYLFQKDELNNLVKQSVDRIYSNDYVGQQIKKLIWEPLEDFVSKGDKVYFSPSGLLHQLAIENLPANDSMTLEEYYPMYRLSSTKELVINKPKGDNKSSALYGGLFYDIDDSIMVAQSSMYNQTNTSAYAMRGYSQDSTLRQGWNYLEGTLTEVDQIGEMMTSGDYKVVKYTGIEGNEESFKALSGKNTGIIHIATHGFFLPIEDTRRNEFMQARLGDQPSGSILSDPMQRSGLMLAGGNKAWQGEEISSEIEDGVMTAKEISYLDLRGTDLVVLSACETGLGEVSGEGVFGLQRSFKQAGAQSLVMTLWEVNDQATDYFMTEFYKSYLAGKEKQESFLEAKKSCRERFPEPQYWAGFVLLD